MSCKIVYKSIDGREFDSMKECEEWNSKPRVWIIQNLVIGGIIHSIYVSKDIAENKLRQLKEEDSFSIYALVSETINTRTEVTVQERITSKKKDTWISKLKGLICTKQI